jgi:acid phosphatase (class A)
MKLRTNLTRSLVKPILFVLAATFWMTGAEAGFVYLRPDSINTRNFQPPPSSGSAADIADLNGVLADQTSRKKEDCDRAMDEAKYSAETFYGMSHAVLNAKEVGLVQGLFDDLGNDSSEFISPLKSTFARPRPFVRDRNIILCVPAVSGFSYPSGHATIARVTARALTLLFPSRAQALLVRGNEVGTDRVIGGVHYPLDIQAGQELGDQIFNALIKSQEFMHRIEQIRGQLPLRSPSR